MLTIDLSEVAGNGTVHNLAGKDRGLAARRQLGLDDLDEGGENVVVKLPADLYAITDSFTLGLLSQSVARFGNLPLFFQKYRFEGNQRLLMQIQRGLERAIAPRPRLAQMQS